MNMLIRIFRVDFSVHFFRSILRSREVLSTTFCIVHYYVVLPMADMLYRVLSLAYKYIDHRGVVLCAIVFCSYGF